MTSTNSKPIINPVHGTGATYATFSPDGRWLYTGGEDVLGRPWRVSQGADQEPSTATNANGAITALAASKACWLMASAEGEVLRYGPGNTDMEAMVLQIPGASIRSMAVDPKGKRVAVASDEITVKLIDLEDTTQVTLLTGHTKAARRVTWHPSGTYLTTSGADGNVLVWDVSEDEPKLVETIRGVIPAVHDSESVQFKHDCSAVWHPSGDYFLVPSRAHDVVAISRSTWTKSFTFSDDTQLGEVTSLALSANGVYLATASKSGVSIWSTQNRRILIQLPHATGDSFVTQLAWSPTQNILAWTDSEGSVVRYPDVIPSVFADPVKLSLASAATATTLKRRKTPDLFGDDLEDEDTKATGPDVDMGGDQDVLGDFLDDDLGDYLKDDNEARFRDGKVEVVNITKAQAAFQPGSTPMDVVKRKRLLAYNLLGYIEVTDQDTHHVVDVKMHDLSPESPRKGYHFTDNYKYDMASLGERGIVFACPPEAGHRAHVAFKPYASWDTGSRPSEEEWTYELPHGVKVLGLAAGGAAIPKGARKRAMARDTEGRGQVVIATSENELTFLTGTGIERYSMGLDGDFVSMVAGPEWVFVVHRDGATTIDGSQNLKGTLITFDDLCVLQERRLPILKNHILKWIGVTEEGAPAIYDSTGVLQIMPRFRMPLRATWARVLDTNKMEGRAGKDESYWPFAVTGDTLRFVVLKGRQEHPPFPVPYPQELSLRLPFRKTDVDESGMEEGFARQSMFLDMSRDALGDELTTDDIRKRETTLDMELIKLIGKACSSSSDRPARPARALDLTRMIHNPAIVDSAIKVAQFYKQRGLEDRMRQVKASREDDDRLYAARERRREYASDVSAIPAPRGPSYGGLNANGPRPFEDFNPPPPVARPGLARAVPTTQSSSIASGSSSLPSSSHNWETYSEPGEDSEPKRKRTPEDEAPAAEPKRRALQSNGASTVASKQKANPFLKKPPGAPANDRFARDAPRTVQKSESFFNKVEAAESGEGKGAAKGKGRDVTRQTTLFGHGMRSAGANGKKAATAKSKGPVQDEETQVVVFALGEETQYAAEDTQATDTQMEETQIDSQGTTLDTQSPAEPVDAAAVNDEDEPMEWPDSPQPISAELAAE